MALGENYITVDELRDYLALDVDLYADVLAGVVASTTNEVNEYCNRQFNDAETVSTRSYRPINCGFYAVDDFSTTDGLVVEIDGMVLDADQFELTPENGIRNGQPGWAYWGIRLTDPFVGSNSKATVTARWGWAEVPAPVKQAAKILAADTFQMKDVRQGVTGTNEWGVMRVRENQTVCDKLKRYQRQKVYVA